MYIIKEKETKKMKKADTSNRLKQVMDDKGLKQVDILNRSLPYQKKFGIKMGKSTLSQYITGKSTPAQKQLFLLAKTLNVSEAWLMGYNVDKERVPDEARINKKETISQKVASITDKLHAPRQNKVLTFAKNQLDEQENETNSYTYNYFDSAISAGTGQYLSDVRVEEIELPVDYDADFVVPVYGDSMEPKYHNQDYVFIKLSVDLSDGSIGVFDLNGDAYIKELRITDKGAYLHSLNPNYKDIQITEDDSFRVIGKVVGRYNENYKH